MSDELHSRLRRLRREGAEAEAAEAAEPDEPAQPGPRGRAEVPTWVTRRLGRVAQLGAQRAADRLPGAAAAFAGAVPEPAGLAPRSAGEPEGLVVERGEHGEFAVRCTAFAETAQHGEWTLAEVDASDAQTIALLCGDPALADLDLRRCVFLDTETTGLGGGAGVYVYMIGLGFFEGDSFQLWQGFLRSPGEEKALLAEAARLLRARRGVVSFFGKSFDRHRLDDKMAITGVPSPFADLPHLDLYHPFQRLTQKRLVDGRLATMESELCGLVRQDDLPGAFAPDAWFDFLAQRPHRLEGVFRHNRDDVLSLVTLAAYLGRARAERRADGRELAGPGAARARGVARSHADRGERGEALAWVERALERERAEGRELRDLLFTRGELLRQLADYPAALEAYAQLGACGGADPQPGDRWTMRALVERAKVLEHRTKDPAAALEACRRALELAEQLCVGSERRRLQAELRHREGRLAGKLA